MNQKTKNKEIPDIKVQAFIGDFSLGKIFWNAVGGQHSGKAQGLFSEKDFVFVF